MRNQNNKHREPVNFHTKGKFFEDILRMRWGTPSPGRDPYTHQERSFLSQISELSTLKKELNDMIMQKDKEIRKANFVKNSLKEKNKHLKLVVDQKDHMINKLSLSPIKSDKRMKTVRSLPRVGNHMDA